jgi:hypothetical protein
LQRFVYTLIFLLSTGFSIVGKNPVEKAIFERWLWKNRGKSLPLFIDGGYYAGTKSNGKEIRKRKSARVWIHRTASLQSADGRSSKRICSRSVLPNAGLRFSTAESDSIIIYIPMKQASPQYNAHRFVEAPALRLKNIKFPQLFQAAAKDITCRVE